MGDDTTLPEGANVDLTDEIAELLTGSEEEVSTTDDTEDLEDKDSEESTEVDESNEEGDETEEDAVEEPEEDDTPETWAGALGVDDGNILLDDGGNFAGVNIKVDGESSTVGMKDLIAGFQTNKHNTNTSQSLATERKDFEILRDSATADYIKKLTDVGKLSEFMNNSLMSEFNSVDWNGLRSSDPAEYAAMYQDFERRKQEVQNVYSVIEQERTKELDLNSNNNNQSHQKYLHGELDKVQANNPEWDTPDKIKVAFRDMATFVDEAYGITPEVFNALGDSRYVEVIKDAMAYRNGKKVTQKKIKQNLPKFQKAKNGKPKNKVSKLDKLTKIAKQQTGANKRDAEVSAIAELLGG